MEKLRGFEIVKGFEDKGINLPVRKTKNSAGYDIEAAEDTVVPAFKPGQKPTLIKTGLKAYCQPDEFYMLCNRSSNPGKKGLVLANSVGIVDSDYYGNEKTGWAETRSGFRLFRRNLRHSPRLPEYKETLRLSCRLCRGPWPCLYSGRNEQRHSLCTGNLRHGKSRACDCAGSYRHGLREGGRLSH